MNVHPLIIAAVACLPAAPKSAESGPALTVYNQFFAVVRQTVPLDLTDGINPVTFSDTTAHLEPDSVILRDPTGRRTLQILEQNYRGDPVSQGLLLSLHEGETIDFLITRGEHVETVPGRIIRSAYVPHYAAMRRYGQQYARQQRAYAYGQTNQPIVEVNGQLRFGLPGVPLFPPLTDDVVLKPTIRWLIETDRPGKFDAELAYVTGGMSWEADYNVVAPDTGDLVDLIGWVTVDNQSGKTFENARIKLIAGDVSKLQQRVAGDRYFRGGGGGASSSAMRPAVTEKSFDEYHLYKLRRRTTLHDRETKQVEFVRASGVRSTRVYVYDGAAIDPSIYRGYNPESIPHNRPYGTLQNPKVWVMREFVNSQDNNLGMPLPRGRVRFYRQDDDGLLELTGENVIDHTPRDEKVRIYTGNAFDIVGERIRMEYNVEAHDHWLDESFKIKLRNHKTEPVEIRIVEHLYRWINWEVIEKSEAYEKTDARTIEFRVVVDPDSEKTVTYKAHYTW